MPFLASSLFHHLGIGCAGWLVLAWFAWRGRRVHDHPCCRRCHYDLSGCAPDNRCCPECGADLRRRRAVRLGLRAAHGPCLLLILFLFATTAWPLALAAFDACRNFDPNCFKSTRALTRELLDRGSASRSLAAAATLRARFHANNLTQTQIDDVVHGLLRIQSDSTQPWFGHEAQIISTCSAAARVTADDWRQYVTQMNLTFTAVARARVRPGDPIPFLISPVCDARILRADPTLANWQQLSALTAQIDQGEPQPIPGTWRLSSGQDSASCLVSPARDLPPGPHILTLQFLSTWRDERLPTPPDLRILPHAVTTSFVVAADPEAEIQSIHAPQLLPAMHRAVHISIGDQAAATGAPDAPADQTCLTVRATSPPVGLSYDICVVQDQSLQKIGMLTCAASQSVVRTYRWPHPFADVPSSILVALIPNPAAAAESVDNNTMWNHPLRLTAHKPLTSDQLWGAFDGPPSP